jgi:small subunit ribosomal protein S6
MAKKTQKPQGNKYEAMFLLGSQAANDLDAGIKTVRGMIEKHEGKIIVLKKWDERKLTYEVKRNKRGTYIIAYFTAPGGAIAPIEREVNLSEEVLRVLVTSADHLTEKEMNAVEPQPIQPREERAPWDRPGFNNDGGSRPDRGDRGDRPPRREEPAGIARE